jgi:hypothetical protein
VAQRILRGAAATLTYEHLDYVGERANATGTITVKVDKADGTNVLPAGTATSAATQGVYTVALTPAQTSSLELLTATWTDSTATSAPRTTTHEIVGGFLFTINDVMEEQGAPDYDRAAIIERRAEVEDECEWITDLAWVPRYRRLTLDGSGEDLIVTGVREIRTVRSARIYSTAGSSSYTSMTALQLAGLVRTGDGQLRRTDGDVWPAGFGNVVLEVEHGADRPPNDLRVAASIRCVDALFRPDSALPLRAKSWTDSAGVSYDLEIPDQFSTGIPRVDSVYHRHSRRVSSTMSGAGKAAGPASRTLSYDPQFFGLFRGGRT